MDRAKMTLAIILVVVATHFILSPARGQAQSPPADPDSSRVTAQTDASFWPSTARDWATVAQPVVPFVVFVLGVWFAWQRLQIFRARVPHMTISHEVSHRRVGTEYVHIAVTTILHNSSKVNIEFFNGFSSIQQVSPSTDKAVEDLYAEVFVAGKHEYLAWDTLGQIRRSWEKDEFVVEPGESETETFEFVISADVKSILITTFFYNSRVLGIIPRDSDLKDAPRLRRKLRPWLEVRGPRGWSRTTVHDTILPEGQDNR